MQCYVMRLRDRAGFMSECQPGFQTIFEGYWKRGKVPLLGYMY